MTDLDLLKRIVIAWDADQDEEFSEAIAAARDHCGFVLADHAEDGTDQRAAVGRSVPAPRIALKGHDEETDS